MPNKGLTQCALQLPWLQKNCAYRKWTLSLLLVVLVTGCKPASQDTDKRLADYQARLQACVDSMESKTRIPIMGGGEIDTPRFAFKVPHKNVTDEGECGAVGFEAEFYWTGEKIVPNAPKFTGLHPTQIPPELQGLRVGAKLGNRRLGQQCKEHFDPTKCPDPNYKAPAPPPTWPENLTVRPKAYPGLEIRLQPVRDPRPSGVTFYMTDWPRKDGVSPRGIYCHSDGVDFPINTMTPAELEQLDFGKRTFPCDVGYASFDFKGGAARISTGTEALRDIVPALKALKALQKYLSDSILKED
jgi:hypothetical protein